MRWKLILIVPLLASFLGAALTVLLLYLLSGSLQTLKLSGLELIATCVAPAVMVVLAGLFVYRHTARRRTLQALLTATVAVFLILSFILAAILVVRRRSPLISSTPSFVSRPQDRQTNLALYRNQRIDNKTDVLV
jgi:uncharacterized membrane protein